MPTFAQQMRGGNHQQNHISAPGIADEKAKVQGWTFAQQKTRPPKGRSGFFDLVVYLVGKPNSCIVATRSRPAVAGLVSLSIFRMVPSASM